MMKGRRVGLTMRNHGGCMENVVGFERRGFVFGWSVMGGD